jgi:MtN3 and saliva related transmembrane protein
MIVLIGSTAAVLTALCWVPQVVRTWRRGSAEDFGWHYLALLLTGVALWCLYGIVRDDPPIYLCNGFVLASVFIVVVVKMRSGETEPVEAQLEVVEPEP